ncbi:olfactory receptor 11L1-like [Rhinophrynus dorsalis]
MVPRQNQSTITEIYLLGFQGLHGWRILLFLVILVIYVVTIAGNLLIIVLVSATRHLQSPMYFFFSHLSMSDILLTSTVSPNMLDVTLKEGAIISFVGCFSQIFMLGVSSATEGLLLTVMSYDRMSSSTGRQKAFSTCSSHLAVVCTYYGTLIAIYVAPSGGHLFNMNKILSLLYAVVTPLPNPIIYNFVDKPERNRSSVVMEENTEEMFDRCTEFET